MDPLRLFLLDQGFPVEYGLDIFNTPHTGTTLRHPQNWLFRLWCWILLWHLATTSPLGNIFWRHSCFSPKQPEPQTNGDFNVYFLKRQTWLLLHTANIIPRTSNDTRCFLYSLITPFRLFTCFLSHKACSTNTNSIFHAAIKNYHKNISTLYFSLSSIYLTTLSEDINTRKNTFLRPKTITNFPIAKVPSKLMNAAWDASDACGL